MNESIDKEKSIKKNFSALDKIKKSKKSNVEKVSEDPQFNLDSVFKNDSKPKEISKNEVSEPILSLQEVTTSVEKKESVIVKDVLIEEEKVVISEQEKQTFDIASRLKPNYEDNEEVLTETHFVSSHEEPSFIENKNSAEIAKDRLKRDVLGEVSLKPLYSDNIEKKRTITANDNLQRILGTPEVTTQPSAIYEDEDSNQNDVVITKKSVFIPWEKAPIEEKRKARKIMSVGVLTTLATLTYFTFH